MLPGSRAPPDVGVSVRLPDARVVRVDQGYLQFLTGEALAMSP